MVGTADRDERVGVSIDGEFTTLAADRILLAIMVLIAYLIQVA